MTIKTARQVRAGGVPAGLTRSEPGLLAALAAVPGRVFSRRELVARVHGYPYEGYGRTADVHVTDLRAEPGDDPTAPRRALTVPGDRLQAGGQAR